MSEWNGIAVFCETANGNLAAISAEGLGEARRLASGSDQKITAICLGSGIGDSTRQAISAGADIVYVTDDPQLAVYEPDAYLQCFKQIVEKCKPAIIIIGQTDIGRDLAPRLSYKLNTAVIMDCVALAMNNGRLQATKPVYGGNAMAVYETASDPQVVTIRTKAMQALEPDASRTGDVIDVPVSLDGTAIRTKTIEKVVEESEGVKLEDAGVVVVGGRGIGSQEGFQQLSELAKLLKGALGASRPPCDNNWVPDTLQVGLTGKIIAPDLYIAVAVSGSSQHMSGCAGSRNIIAINKDKEANIFRHARYGAVGDWKKILPAFTSKVKELVES